MSRKATKGIILISGLAAATYSVYKATKEFIEYQKLKNKDVYIDTDMTEVAEKDFESETAENIETAASADLSEEI